MKSAFVTASVSRDAGGLFFAMTSLGKSLHQLGVDLSVHGVIDPHTHEDASAWSPVNLGAHPRSGPAALAYAPQLGNALGAGGYEILHTHGIWLWPSAAVHRWHQKTGKPYVISPHGMLDPWAVAQSRWKKRIVSALYESAHLRDAACIHALCQSEADAIRAYGLKNPVCVIPNGVDLPEERGEELSVVGCPLSDELGVSASHSPSALQMPGSRLERSATTAINRQRTTDNGQRTLLFLGRLHPKKGLVNALRAWHSLLKTEHLKLTNSSWTFAIAGWDQGGHEAELKQLCDELGLGWADVPAAEFVGPLRGVPSPWSLVELEGSQGASQAHDPLMNPSEAMVHDRPGTKGQGPRTATPVAFLGPAFGEAKDALLRSASAFILPSFSEGLPMAVLEAMAYRLPVLMTDACNLPEGFAAGAAIRIGTEVAGEWERGRGGEGEIGRVGEGARGIADGLRMLMEMSDPEREAMGARGRALVEGQFTWPQVAAQMKEVYEWVLGGGAKPECVRD